MKPHWHHGACAALALAAALVYMLLQAPAYDEPTYFEDVAKLRQIRQLDAKWELDVMKTRLNLSHGYDALVSPLQDMERLPSQLHVCPDNFALAAEVAAFREALAAKAALVEAFKSRNAVFRNALSFLPVIADEAELLAWREPGRAGAARSIREALLAALVYLDQYAEGDRHQVEAYLAALAASQRHLDAAMRPLVANFELHARIVLREHGEINRLLAAIMEAPIERSLDQVHTLLGNELQRASDRVRQQRQYLLALSVALSALLVYAAARLLRSHALINRYNASLQQANDTLERRVLERTRQLQETQTQLVDAARKAGKAEVATNVLHNVGNVLNSVTVSAALLQQQVRASRGAGLEQAVALMREQGDALGSFLQHDERGRCLPEYLEGLALVWRTEREAMARELAQLHGSVDHVKEIVAAQQADAGAACVFELCAASGLIDQAIGMSALSLTRHGILVARDYAALPPQWLDRHRVLQILVNLIGNAQRAMEGVPGRAHRITLRLRRADGGALHIEVADNGEGIRPENQARIFTHGFTTRKDGHGFGLHSCVLAARDMGGALRVHSAGAGQGATFTLELPVRQEEPDEIPA